MSQRTQIEDASPTSQWEFLEPSIDAALAADPDPIAALARGDVPAIILRGAFPPEECAALVRMLIERGLMFEGGDTRIDDRAIPVDRVDRWTQQGLNPAASARRRIDVGTSLGNYGGDQEDFLERSAESLRLFQEMFASRPNPIAMIYKSLERLAPGKQVVTAYEPDGRQYGPAIFRIHYGGYTYGPHFDSVRLRESRAEYAVYRFERQLAGVLCIQNTTLDGQSAQSVLHRQFWTPEIDPILKTGGFHDYAREHYVPHKRVELEPGDLYFFNTGMIHEVPGVPGPQPRIVLATFIGYSADDPEIMVWS